MLVYVQSIQSPIGEIIIAATSKGLCVLDFSYKDLQSLVKNYQCKVIHKNHPHLIRTRMQLHEYFLGKRKFFDIPLDTMGTDFQQQVWQALLNIPYGRTISYKTEAQNIGKESAVRAVANANGANKISIIIPCHRVIASNGGLGGYTAGITKKTIFTQFRAE